MKNLLNIFSVICLTFLNILMAPKFVDAKNSDFNNISLKKISNYDNRVIEKLYNGSDSMPWKSRKKEIIKIKSELLRKVVYWNSLTAKNSGATFHEIQRFIVDNPTWPLKLELRKRAEESIKPSMKENLVINWFKKYPPLTVDGSILLGSAFLKKLQNKKAIDIFQKTWINGNFGKRQERLFYKRYRKYLTKKNHIDRLDRLLWMGRYYPIRRMFNKVNKDYRALAFARITLRQYRGGVDRAISKVPKILINDPGLLYERLRWRRKKGRLDGALEILNKKPDELNYTAQWWRERSYLVRRALKDGHITNAYKIASEHKLKAGSDFAEGEWLAGWIAFKFLNDRNAALSHFQKLYETSKYPISKARGAYWAARASQKLRTRTLRDMSESSIWLKKAAEYPLTYYGQLAFFQLNKKKITFSISSEKKFKKLKLKFSKNELVRTIKLMSESTVIKFKNQIKPLIKKLYQSNNTITWRYNLAKLAEECGRKDLSIYVAKNAYRDSNQILKLGYPTINLPYQKDLNKALIFALIRQESAFNSNAKSFAGALGLMQLMPLTAKQVSIANNIPYIKESLTKDKEYNMILGTWFLSNLVQKFDGSYALALAAYNAGPSRVKKWIKEFGDPRLDEIEIVDWIETIPFKETRNYIQRVIESKNVYDFLLEKN